MPSLLIIDDDANLGVVLGRSLRGYDVTFVTSAEEGLELVRQRPFDGILCDVHLPRLTGVDFHAGLVAMRPELEPRLVFMTGGAASPEIDAFLAARPDHVLSKPFELERLRKTVARVVLRTSPHGASKIGDAAAACP